MTTSTTNWDSGMDYGFFAIRSMMWTVGLWPVQRNNVIYTMQWLVAFAIGSLTMLNVLIESFRSCGIARDGLEIFRLIESCVHAWLNLIFPRIYMKKLAVNVNSAIDDWSSPFMRKESRATMTAYARTGRLVALAQLAVGSAGSVLWFASVFLDNRRKVASNNNATTWNFVLPSTCLYKGVSYSTYELLFAMQIVQGTVVFIAECACDSFFFSITVHLCGQLELLKMKFTEIDKNSDNKHRNGNILGPLVERHCHLIVLARNIEDAFNIYILLRLLIINIVIATGGINVILLFNDHDYKGVLKIITAIQFYMVQIFLYTYAGDILQNQSLSILSAVYNSTWYEMSPVTVKDLVFVMMRTKIPLRISAGKFFYLTRATMTDILKTTLSYISFLRVTMEN
ncbi:odorant receptor 22c-like [Pseudomyrmex gracilis]|uniref:odorant receptor 22c-like n=1 Tax=Pseudomyrmex gracilis TaxID=219809 RepID=UPI000995C228|nr:odorant receptor 22c-like [Pseudomyrmex gracilis]